MRSNSPFFPWYKQKKTNWALDSLHRHSAIVCKSRMQTIISICMQFVPFSRNFDSQYAKCVNVCLCFGLISMSYALTIALQIHFSVRCCVETDEIYINTLKYEMWLFSEHTFLWFLTHSFIFTLLLFANRETLFKLLINKSKFMVCFISFSCHWNVNRANNQHHRLLYGATFSDFTVAIEFMFFFFSK